MIVLRLPYPPSANRYWRTRIVVPSFDKITAAYSEGGLKGLCKFIADHSFVNTYLSGDAKQFKEAAEWIARAAGLREAIAGRIRVDIALYPQRPQDWSRRAKKDPETWDDDVRCIDLDNANKVLLDALKGIAFEDDKWVRELHARRMEPDGDARVVVTITPIGVTRAQAALELA